MTDEERIDETEAAAIEPAEEITAAVLLAERRAAAAQAEEARVAALIDASPACARCGDQLVYHDPCSRCGCPAFVAPEDGGATT